MNNRIPLAKDGLSGQMAPLLRSFAHPRFLLSALLGVLLLSLPARAVAAEPPSKPPAFLTVGGRYGFCLMIGAERPIWVVKVLELGPEGWVHVQRLAPRPLGAVRGDKAASKAASAFEEPWINFSQVGAVIMDDAPAAAQPDNVKPAETFPKLGGRYFFGAGPSTLPYFAEVLENGDEGWFRVQELHSPLDSKPADRKFKQWWVRGAAVAWLDEVKSTPAEH